MPEPTDVLLVSDDPGLCESVARHQPARAALHRVSGHDMDGACAVGARQVWVDLDINHLPDLPSGDRRVYFYSDPEATRREMPPGLYVRKPCPELVLDVLWAGVELVAGPHATARATAAGAVLPNWLLDFHVLELKELCRKCVLELPRRLGFRDASLYLYDARHGLLTLAETTLTRTVDLTVPVDATDRRLMAVVAREGQILRTPQAGRALAARGISPDAARGYLDDECLVAPLLSAGRLWGVLNLSGRVADAPHEAALVPEFIFTFLGRALHHASVYEQARLEARVDGLTGLYNQRWMAEALGREIRRAQRYGTTLSALMIDVDELKVVNDGIGHAAGDALLRHTAGRIAGILRRFDGAARVGGDEFVVMLPATDLKGAQHVGQRLIRSIHEDVAEYRGRPLPTTVSVGAAEWRAGWDAERLLKAADGALYRAKRRGRNRLASAAQRRTRAVRLGQPPGSPATIPPLPAAPAVGAGAASRPVAPRSVLAVSKDRQSVVPLGTAPAVMPPVEIP